MGELPTGTVTLLLADVEGSTRLWETQPDEMTAAVARLDATLTDLVAAHGGVRPVEQGEGDSFVVAFARASDAVACALALQRAPLAPIRLADRRAHRRDPAARRGQLHRPDDQPHRAAARSRPRRPDACCRVRPSRWSSTICPTTPGSTTSASHPLRDLPRPERVVQLCHPDIRNEFPPLADREGSDQA